MSTKPVLQIARAESLSSHAARERLRRRFRPEQVQILFVGEAPPASGRFFYRADSGLYRAVRETFISAFPSLENAEFLRCFCTLGCYLVDLCGQPVDRFSAADRRLACVRGEVRLARRFRQLQPRVIVTVVQSIGQNVRRAEERASWTGQHVEVPYPGRWHSHRLRFRRSLVPLLRRVLGESVQCLDLTQFV